MTIAEIHKAIEHHDAWRRKLVASIRTGTLADGLGNPLSPDHVSCDDKCQFGKWLRGTSPTGPRSMPDYKDVLALNVAFHAEAGRVLSLALAGNIADAEKESAVNSRLGKLSAAIMVKLNLWTTLFDTTPKEAHPAHSGGYHARVNHS